MFGRTYIGYFWRLLIALFATHSAFAAEVLVNVVDADGQPVANAAVYVKQRGLLPTNYHSPEPEIMDQRDTRFVPHILIVKKGALVRFPNSDIVAHQVYSFSRPNNFVLPLYKGTPSDPVAFNHEGLVTLGCNIHDGMLGYILVVDSSAYGLTDKRGIVSLAVNDAASSYEINIWSPRFRDSSDSLVQTVSAIPSGGVTFNLLKSLRPAYDDQSEAVQWDEY